MAGSSQYDWNLWVPGCDRSIRIEPNYSEMSCHIPHFYASEIGVINAPSQNINQLYIIEGNLEVKLPTIWADEKQSREEAERRGRLEERRVEEKE